MEKIVPGDGGCSPVWAICKFVNQQICKFLLVVKRAGKTVVPGDTPVPNS